STHDGTTSQSEKPKSRTQSAKGNQGTKQPKDHIIDQILLRLSSFGSGHQATPISPGLPSVDTPAAIIAQEWQQHHAPNRSRTSIHRLTEASSKALSKISKGARHGAKAVKTRVVTKGSAFSKGVGHGLAVVRTRGVLGAIHNVG